MHAVIQKVVAAETEAKRMVEVAQAEANRISEDAQKQRQVLLARALQETSAEAQGIVEASVRIAEQEKRQCLLRLASEIETELQLDETTRQDAVEAVIRCVCAQR